jgi:endonuclease YncB( thermonuclease family)
VIARERARRLLVRVRLLCALSGRLRGPVGALAVFGLPALLWAACSSDIRTVRRVFDGDTVQLDDAEVVRLLGIDTPERGEPFYARATTYLAARVKNRNVRIEFDRTRRDTYKRLLAFIWLGDTLINEELVRQGYARVYVWPPDTLHFARLVAAQSAARRQRRGVWSVRPPKPEALYVIQAERLRFHRPGCRAAPRQSALRGTSRDSLLDLGFSACRTCRP